MSKYLIFFIIIGFTKSFSQINKERVVIIFDSSKDTFIHDIITVDNQSFKYIAKKKTKKKINFISIKDDICTINDLNIKIAKKIKPKKKSEFYYSDFFDIYIYIKDKKKSGQLYPVEKVWLVEKLIKD